MSEKYLVLPLSFEYLMSALFGMNNYHGYVGTVSLTTWKKDMAKVTRYIRKSIEINCNCDEGYKKDLLARCDHLGQLISESRTVQQINIALIEKLINIVFNLLGTMPHHWDQKKPYRDQFWNLSGHRTLVYLQNNDQKAHLIIYLIDIVKKYTIDFGGYSDMHGVYYRKFKGKSSQFVSWFKKEHPDKYCEIF